MRLYQHFLNKILAIMGFGLFLIVLCFTFFIPPASNYEFSIYNSYPSTFWLGLIAVFIIGCCILLNAGINNETQENSWIFGFLLILLVNVILLFMPIIRGYLNFGSGDVLTHIGWMKDIIRIGHVSSSNMYPIDHILGVIIHFFSGLSLQNITMIIPAVFSIFFIIAFYLFSTTIFSRLSERLFIVLFSSILLFGNGHMAFAPNPQAFMLLPFLLYLIYKSNIWKGNNIFSLLLVLITSLLVFFHPLISIIMIAILILFKMSSWIYKKSDIPSSFHKKLNTPIVIATIVFFSWSSYIFVLLRTIKPIIQSITGSAETLSEFQRYSTLLGEVNPDTAYLIRLVLSIYGQSIILGLASLVCSLYILYKIIKNTKIPFIILVSSICFMSLFSLSIAMFFINGAFGFGRIYSCALLFSLILIPTTFLMMKRDLNINSIAMVFFTLIIIGSILWFSLFNLYMSPIIKYPNQQVTQGEYYGMTAFFQFRDENIKILEYGLSQDRFYDAIYGRDYHRVNVYYGTSGIQLLPPDHFNYRSGNSLGDAFEEAKYFLLTNQGRFYYQNVYPEFPDKWRFTPDDFQRLNYDTSVQQIYKNGNLDIMMIV